VSLQGSLLLVRGVERCVGDIQFQALSVGFYISVVNLFRRSEDLLLVLKINAGGD
jgi:hypothetical protein